ncbi:MAG: hypothetical protein RSB55_06840 [Oscillospiraceae bacterium]
MKTTTTAAIAAANELAYSDYHIHLGVDRRAVSKDLGTKTNISIWCYTNGGRYKGCYKCGSVDNSTGEYTPGYDADLTATLTAMAVEPAAEPAPAEPTAEPATEPATLTGSEKQIAWATDLRANAVAAFRWAAANPSGAALAEPEKFAENVEKCIARIQSAKSAHHLIETFKSVNFSQPNPANVFSAVFYAMNNAVLPKYF